MIDIAGLFITIVMACSSFNIDFITGTNDFYMHQGTCLGSLTLMLKRGMMKNSKSKTTKMVIKAPEYKRTLVVMSTFLTLNI